MKPSSMRFSIKYFGISNAGRSFKTSDFTWLVYAKPNTFNRKCYHFLPIGNAQLAEFMTGL